MTPEEIKAAEAAAAEINKLTTPVEMATFEQNMDPVLKSKLPNALSADDLPDERDLFNPIYHSLQKNLIDVKAVQDKIAALDPDLPSNVKDQRKAAFLADLTADMEKGFMDDLAQLDQKLTVQENNMIPTPKHKTEVQELMQEIKAQEIRSILVIMNKSDLAQELFSAAQAGRTDVLDAIKTAPFPIVSDDLAERATQIYTENHLPDLLTMRAKHKGIIEKANGKMSALLFAVKQL